MEVTSLVVPLRLELERRARLETLGWCLPMDQDWREAPQVINCFFTQQNTTVEQEWKWISASQSRKLYMYLYRHLSPPHSVSFVSRNFLWICCEHEQRRPWCFSHHYRWALQGEDGLCWVSGGLQDHVHPNGSWQLSHLHQIWWSLSHCWKPIQGQDHWWGRFKNVIKITRNDCKYL